MGLPDINLLGVYFAPVVGPILIAWLIYAALRRIGARPALRRYVWHPALFGFATYVTLLSVLAMFITQ